MDRETREFAHKAWDEVDLHELETTVNDNLYKRFEAADTNKEKTYWSEMIDELQIYIERLKKDLGED